MDDNYLTVVDENGSEMLCEILFTFDSEEYEKSYVLYIPVEAKDDEEDVEVLCSSYTPQEDGSIGQLSPIENDDEWAMIEEVFNTYISNADEDEDEDDDCECCHHHGDEEDDDCDCDCDCEHHHDEK